MTDTRRDFIKKATLLAGASGLFTVLPESIQKALAIDADKGTTFMDAEHIVFLMQENRSFDHCYGTLQGVRGFDDPRAMHLPGQNKVWLQSNKAGETYVPFNLDIKNSKATWMQSLPHSWEDQVDARNGGKMDNWLESKKSGNKQYAAMPLTMGYYDRNDIPFYYAFADAFTVCDQHFCSSLTGTSSNRSYFWAATIREQQNAKSKALVYNGEINYQDLTATTFPERLEQLGISWKVYQNEISIDVGLTGDEDDWLSNFTDNNLEFYKNYNVKLHKAHLAWLPKRRETLEAEIAEMQKQPVTPVITSQLKKKSEELDKIKTEITEWTQERFDKLSDFEKNIHLKAFATNVNDPYYHKLSSLTYDDNGTQREVKVPKGDILHQFRHDVKTGKLPTVSWLAAPSNFSDHPGSPWYGAWYVSEVLDILTHNPEVWKKTIFILTYDENDGYFDHVAPFVPPNTATPESGGASAGLNTEIEHVTKEQNQQHGPSPHQRESPIGLGFRVPMVVASPWSRGGWVNSQVFDHTSTLQFLETFLSKKTGKAVKETNISDWRRTVCGDLTSIFRPYNGEKISYPVSLNRDKTVQSIHQAKFKGLPNKFKALAAEDIKAVNSKAGLSNFAKQEKGSRQSCALPYDLHVDGQLSPQNNALQLAFKTGKGSGAPFNVYGPVLNGNKTEIKVWNFAVKANDEVKYEFALDSFNEGIYNIQAHGPNGFLRTFAGDKNDPGLTVDVVYQSQGDIEISFTNTGSIKQNIVIADNGYKANNHQLSIAAGASSVQKLNLQKSHHWYDFTVSLKGNANFSRGYAGRVETGKHGFTDPLIGA